MDTIATENSKVSEVITTEDLRPLFGYCFMGILTIGGRSSQFVFEIRNHRSWERASTLPYINELLNLLLLRRTLVSLRLTQIRGGK